VLEDLADEQLMARYQRGDAKAYEVLLSRHYGPVFNYLLRNTGNRSTAEDLLQDVFFRVIRGAKDYKQRAKFTTWLYTIARNIVIDAARKRKFRRHESLDQPVQMRKEKTGQFSKTLIDGVADKHPSTMADRRLADSEFTKALQEALMEMNPAQREVFVLREFQSLSFAEVAGVVNAPENTVKSRMRYALEFLRDRLKDFAEDNS
jgi:RNA polymerase sigma-70 factor (ECF subfamily)